MDSFFGITIKRWLDSLFSDHKSLPVQVYETNSADKQARVAAKIAQQHGLIVFSFEYKANLSADPYYIFRQVLTEFSQLLGEEYITSIIEANAYYAHKKILLKWFNRKPYYRHEPMLYEESGYERYELYASFSRILKALAAKQKFLFILNNIHNAPHAIMDFIGRTLDADFASGDYGVIAFLAKQKSLERQVNHMKWPRCLNRLERMGLIFPLEDEIESRIQDSFWDAPKPIQTFNEQMNVLAAAVDLFAFEDVIEIIKTSHLDLNHEQVGRLLFLSGYANLMVDQIDAAIRDFNQSLNRLQASPSENILMAVYYWLTICFAIKGQEKYARANQEQLEKLALEYENQRFYTLSQFAFYYINSKISQHCLVSNDIEVLKYQLTTLGYDNLRSFVLLQVFTPVSEEFLSPKLLLLNCINALRSYRRQKNLFGVSTALQALGICHSRLGNNAQTTRLFIISLKLRENFQGQTNLIFMLNGLGYHCTSLEKWVEAWNYYDSALETLIDSKNYTELSITLFNYSWLYGQSGNFLWAIDIINDLLVLMRSRGIDTLPFRNLKDVYAYKGWLHMQANQPIQAQYCLLRFQKLTHLHNTAFSAVLEQLLKTSLALINGHHDLAMHSLNKAAHELERSEDFDLYMLSTMELEVARLNKKMGCLEEAKQIFDALRVRAQKFGYSALAQRISRASLGLTLTDLSPLPAIKRPYRLLMQLANKESRVIELQNELSDLHQANLLLELSTTEPTFDGFLAKVIEILDRRIPADHLMVILSDSHLDIEDIEVSNDSSSSVILQCKDYLQDKDSFKSLISFDLADETFMAWPLDMKACQRAWLIVSGDEGQSLVWNKDYIQLVAQQLGLVLDRRFREVQLEQLTRTDMLTGILNRSGLFERMKKHFSHMKRTPSESFTLCYFDLDHFKYFNDHFGHELGDKVLKALTDLVLDNLRETDEFGRIGGDEFILLLPDADRADAEQILTRIRIAVARPNWWLSLLDISDDSKNPIAKENWITASFGALLVHGWPDQGLSRKELMGQADKLMYQAKTEGRNRICIRDFIDTTD